MIPVQVPPVLTFVAQFFCMIGIPKSDDRGFGRDSFPVSRPRQSSLQAALSAFAGAEV